MQQQVVMLGHRLGLSKSAAEWMGVVTFQAQRQHFLSCPAPCKQGWSQQSWLFLAVSVGTAEERGDKSTSLLFRRETPGRLAQVPKLSKARAGSEERNSGRPLAHGWVPCLGQLGEPNVWSAFFILGSGLLAHSSPSGSQSLLPGTPRHRSSPLQSLLLPPGTGQFPVSWSAVGCIAKPPRWDPLRGPLSQPLFEMWLSLQSSPLVF